jgi:hypothetical protein
MSDALTISQMREQMAAGAVGVEVKRAWIDRLKLVIAGAGKDQDVKATLTEFIVEIRRGEAELMEPGDDNGQAGVAEMLRLPVGTLLRIEANGAFRVVEESRSEPSDSRELLLEPARSDGAMFPPETSIREIGISLRAFPGLEAAGIRTVADVSAALAAGRDLSEIAGVGEATAGKLAAAAGVAQ